jgi:hypothetical protein
MFIVYVYKHCGPNPLNGGFWSKAMFQCSGIENRSSKEDHIGTYAYLCALVRILYLQKKKKKKNAWSVPCCTLR